MSGRRKRKKEETWYSILAFFAALSMAICGFSLLLVVLCITILTRLILKGILCAVKYFDRRKKEKRNQFNVVQSDIPINATLLDTPVLCDPPKALSLAIDTAEKSPSEEYAKRKSKNQKKYIRKFDANQYAIECNAYVIKKERMEEQEEMMKKDEERSLASGKKPDLEENAVHQESDPNFDAMNGVDFENFCMDLLKRNGYKNVHGTKTSGDQGIDILAEKDDIRYGIQCKCYRGSVGNASVQQAFSGKSFYNCHVAVVMTNSSFTQSAVELAQKNNVLLWGKTKLLELNGELSENH